MKKTIIIAGAVVGIILILMIGFNLMMSAAARKITFEPNTDAKDKVQPIKIGHANIYLIKMNRGYILVDTPMPRSEKQLDKALELAKVKPKDVKLIIATHAHLDRVGALAYAKELTGARVLAHKDAAKYLIKTVRPDFEFINTFYLDSFGIPGKVITTPGQTKGSVSIILRNGETLVGDMVRPEGKKISLGRFYDDKDELLESLKKVAAEKPKKIYLSHGKTTDLDALKKVIKTLE